MAIWQLMWMTNDDTCRTVSRKEWLAFVRLCLSSGSGWKLHLECSYPLPHHHVVWLKARRFGIQRIGLRKEAMHHQAKIKPCVHFHWNMPNDVYNLPDERPCIMSFFHHHSVRGFDFPPHHVIEKSPKPPKWCVFGVCF